MSSLRTLAAGVAVPSGAVFGGHVGVILAASLTGLLAMLIVVLALAGVFAPDIATKADAVRVLRILLNREDAGCEPGPRTRTAAPRIKDRPGA